MEFTGYPSSQPDVYSPKLERTYSENPYTKSARQGISVEERDMKISKLEDFIRNATDINNGKNNYTADEILTQDDKGNQVKFFYFIGRLNPPHNGHIKALETLVEMAKREHSVALILLGSGPKRERTLDNPITFELKKQFITRLLDSKFIGEEEEEEPIYEIQEMKNPAQDVSNYIREELEKSGNTLENIENITITHIAGGKDEDTTKLDFVKKSAEKTAKGIVPRAIITTGVEAIDAAPTDSGEAMSATKVRKDAYRTVLDGSGFEGWAQRYRYFYGPDSEEIYDEILFPLHNIPEDDRINVINNYIENGILPQVSKKRKTGGTKRKLRKNKKKTQKRKRRISRRKY
jgi:nicotinamide mononucleotide adenylyltransferase